MSTVKTHKHAFHFDSADHEYESSKQGVWLFMVTEVLMFGALLMGYMIFKVTMPETARAGAEYLSWQFGAFNTVVLLFSSLTMALGIYYIRLDKRKAAQISLGLTLLCGLIFMCVKYIEYTSKISHGLLPGAMFTNANETVNLPLYFSFYYCLTGLHGLHVLIGMGLIAWIMIRIGKGHYGSNHWTGVEGVGIFWHLVDLVWIYLFPLLYLVE